MTQVTIRKNAAGDITGFSVEGHVDFRLEGNDVLCAAVSTLVSHTIGMICEFTDDACENTVDEEKPEVVFNLTVESPSRESRLALNSFESSIYDLAEAHPDNISLVYKEV